MAQIDDELAIRRVLADMTDDQPPAPPSRYAAIRRRATEHRRRQLAGAAAAVAILVAAAIAIPLGLRHFGPQPPSAPSRHYHVSEYPPGPHSPQHLIGYGVVNHLRWNMFVYRQASNFCWGATFPPVPGMSGGCNNWPPPPASNDGNPASDVTAVGTTEQVDVGSTRSDVSYLRIFYNNGQVLTVHPVAVFGRRYAGFFAFPAPYSAAMTEVAAYSRTGELAYAIPFNGDGNISLVRWIPSGQPALPRPATAVIGSGVASGGRWRLLASVGPWGTCFSGRPAGATSCYDQVGWTLGRKATASVTGTMYVESKIGYSYGHARPDVAYLVFTTARGLTTRANTVTVNGTRFFAFASLQQDPVVRWAAYDASGHQLAAGRGTGP